MKQARYRWVDVLLATLGAAFGWVSLTYPFGRDQGLYYYVGREWALRGSIPYKDVFDHKTPAIYFVHALCVAVFGEKQYGIRILDLAAVLALGWIAGAIVSDARKMPRAPLRGAGAFAASVLFFGFLNWMASSEGEAWVALGTLGALRLAWSRTAAPERRAHASLIGSGALAGFAFLVKPIAALLILVVLFVIVWDRRRAWRAIPAALLAFGAGAVAVIGVAVLYFVYHGALRSFHESVVETNRLYVRTGGPIKTPGDLLVQTGIFLDWYRPVSPVLTVLLAAGVVRAIVRGDRKALGAHLVGLALTVLAWVGVMVQGKFYQGHWGVMIAGLTIVALNVAVDGIGLFADRAKPLAASAACALLLALYGQTEHHASEYWALNGSAARWLRGHESREQFLSHFIEFFVMGPSADNEACGNWLREHTNESDYVAVRGFQPQVYSIARRRYPGRLFWTVFVFGPGGGVRREQWLAEDRASLAAHPPKFVAAFAFVHDTTEGTSWWIVRGYTERTKIGDFTILEHTPETATQGW